MLQVMNPMLKASEHGWHNLEDDSYVEIDVNIGVDKNTCDFLFAMDEMCGKLAGGWLTGGVMGVRKSPAKAYGRKREKACEFKL